MSVSVRDARGSAADRRWIAGIYREYLDDLVGDDTGIFPALGEVGHSEPDQIARWFADVRCIPLVLQRSRIPVGFAMIVRLAAASPAAVAAARTPSVDYRFEELFVLRAHRRLGIAGTAVPIILDRFAGRWEIVELQRNHAAVSFWRRVVSSYTGGRYVERVADGEVRQTFQSAPRRGP